MMKRITAQICISLVLGLATYAQGDANTKVNLSKPYRLNYSLIFLKGCQPLAFPDNIIFTQGSCRVDAYSGKIFSRGTKVKIYSVVKGEDFAKVRFRYWPEIYELESEYEILLKSDSDRNFRKSFELLFSERKVSDEYDCPNGVETKKQVIQCLGFPISVEREGDVEKYFYILEFVGPNPFSGYDGFTLKIMKGKVIDVYGYI
jgi:hypothetical protein